VTTVVWLWLKMVLAASIESEMGDISIDLQLK
jgi:hypothetical protein